MAVAAIAHIFVFSAAPYRAALSPEYDEAMATATSKTQEIIEEDDGKNTALFKKEETRVESHGTSITESVQDIVLQGGQCVMKDVVLTLNQAMGPVEKGVTKIQETFLKKSGDSEEEVEVKVEEKVEEIA